MADQNPQDPNEALRRLLQQLSAARSAYRRELQRLADPSSAYRRELRRLADPDRLRRDLARNLADPLRQARHALNDPRRWAQLQRNLRTAANPQAVDQLVARMTQVALPRAAVADQLQHILDQQREFLRQLDHPADRERLKRQLVGDAEQWRLLRRQVASFGNPDLWAGLRRQLAPLRDTSVLEELRKHAAEPVPREHLEALRRDTEELDELADTLGDLGDPTQASDDLSWIESLPLATAARLFVKLLDYTVVLSTYLSTLGLIPPVLVPALTTLHRVLKALHDRLERENHDR